MNYFLLDGPAQIHCSRNEKGGFITQVANGELILPMPAPPENPEAHRASINQSVEEILNGNFETAPIGPADGQTFEDPDLLSFLNRVKSLAEMGYRLPAHLISSIETQIEEAELSPSTRR